MKDVINASIGGYNRRLHQTSQKQLVFRKNWFRLHGHVPTNTIPSIGIIIVCVLTWFSPTTYKYHWCFQWDIFPGSTTIRNDYSRWYFEQRQKTKLNYAGRKTSCNLTITGCDRGLIKFCFKFTTKGITVSTFLQIYFYYKLFNQIDYDSVK